MSNETKSPYDPTKSQTSQFQLESKEAQQLRRDLITRCIEKELNYLLKVNFIKALRPKPNTPLEPNANSIAEIPLPFMKHFFKKYVLSFPFLAIGNINEFLDKLEVFIDYVLNAKLSTESDRSDVTKRTLILLKLEKLLVLVYNNSINLDTTKLLPNTKFESPVMGHTPSQTSVNDTGMNQEFEKMNLTETPNEKKQPQGVVYKIDVVGVRQVIRKGTFRESSHGEFIIYLDNKENDQLIYTNKRFDGFRQLYKVLIKQFPLLELPPVPEKVKDPIESLYREGDRLNLRSFLRRLLALPQVALSDTMYRFLTEDTTELTEEDKVDIQQRQHYQSIRNSEMKQYITYVSQESARYKHLWDVCKTELAQPDGLMKFEQNLRETSKMEDLPEHYLAALEWGRLNFAATLYTTYCTTDNSVRFYQALVSTHKQIPYRTLSTVLKYSNPTLMMKGVMDLLLAQPFGAASLMQRVLSTSVSDQVRVAKDEIQEIEKEINDPLLCQRINNFVYKPEARATTEIPVNSSDYDRLLAIMNDHDVGPDLSMESIQKFWNAKQWVDQYNDSNSPPPQISLDQSGVPVYPEFLLLEKMHDLFVLQTRKRDLEQMTTLLFEGVTGDLMKDVLSIFYAPLAQVYQAADISSFVMEVSRFIDALIQTIDKVNHRNNSSNSSNDEKENSCGPLNEFLELSKRFEPILYQFIHSLYKQSKDGLFQNMLNWLSDMLGDFKAGVNKSPLDLLDLIHSNIRENDFPALKSDLVELRAWHWRRKVRRARNLQKKLIDSSGQHIDNDVKAQILADAQSSHVTVEEPGEMEGTMEDDDKEEDVVDLRRRSSVFDTGFGLLAAEDLREMEDIEELTHRAAYSDPFAAQGMANADLSQPMEVRLNPFGITSDSSSSNFPATEMTTTSSEAVLSWDGPDLNSTPARIKKFVRSKVLPQISQEPYPEDSILVIPTLVDSFRHWVHDNLTM